MKNARLGCLIAVAVAAGGCQKDTVSTESPSSSGAAPSEAHPAAANGNDGNGSGSAEAGAVQLRGTWSLAERSTWNQIYEDRTQYLNLMNTGCGSSVTMTFDHEAFRERLPSVDSNRNEDWNASAMLNAIRAVCLEGAMEKTAVATKIRTITFERAPGKKHDLRGNALTIALDLDANPREYVNNFSAWLRTAL